MTNPIKEAWDSGRPIFSRLPGLNEGYTGNVLADYLSAFWDELFIQTRSTVEAIPTKQLNPALCDSEWLDFLAPLFGWDDLHWNRQWSIEGKRKLLSNSYSGQSIWETKGTLETLSFVLDAVGIRNFIRVDGDFIIGSSEVGDELGFQPWEYTIYLPPSYRDTDHLRECLAVDALFGPCYCIRNIIYDGERFRLIELLATTEEQILSPEADTALIGNETEQ